MPVIHRTAFEVAAIGKDLLAGLVAGELSRLREPRRSVGTVEEAARPGQSHGVANEVIAPQIPFDIVRKMMGLPPQAREQSLGKFRMGRPPARAEPQGRE